MLGLEQKGAESMEFPYAPAPHVCTAFPIINIPHKSGISVTINEPTLTRHDHSKTIVYISVYSWYCTFCEFDKFVRTCIYHHSIMWNSFTALKILCAPPIYPSFSRP